MTQLFASPAVTIHLHEEKPFPLEIGWRGFVNSATLRGSLETALHLTQLHRSTHWIVNNAALRALRPADAEWLGTSFLPLLEVTHLGVVDSKDAINRMSLNTTLTTFISQTSICLRHFTTLAEARLWCLSSVVH